MTSGQKSFSLSLCCKAVESEKNSFADKKDVNGYVAKVIIDIFSSPNITLAVVKEKASAMDADLFVKSKGQTQNCIFEPQIYSFLFRHFVNSFRKSRKSPENSAFCVVSCKTVISDKW